MNLISIHFDRPNLYTCYMNINMYKWQNSIMLWESVIVPSTGVATVHLSNRVGIMYLIKALLISVNLTES